jgi:hypothetical protein
MTETRDLRREIAEVVAAAVAPIAAAVTANTQKVDGLAAQWAEQDRRALEDRRASEERARADRGKLYDRMGEVQTETARLAVHVQTAGREVSEVKSQLAGFEPRLRAVESFRNGVAGEHRGASRVRDRLRNLLALAIACAGAAATWWSLWGKK